MSVTTAERRTAAEADKAEALRELRRLVKPGSTLHTISRHVSGSGMSHSISVVKVSRGQTISLDGLCARVGLGSFDRLHGGIKRGGCGMDMGFDLVYSLSYLLYGRYGKRTYACLGDRCPSNEHVNDRTAPRGKGVRHDDGYAISQRWL